ncbi:MAG: hypothetical protein RL277_2189 [Planctomycetota bacterium]|jgi:hypothetical protein
MLNPSKIKLPDLDRPIHWIDFEGRKRDAEPALVTERVNRSMETIVHDPRLAMAARYNKLRVQGFGEYARHLIERVRDSNGLIGAYSQHEFKEICRVLPDEREWLEQNYINANANSWFKRVDPELFIDLKKNLRTDDSVGLKDYLQHPKIGYRYPEKLLGMGPAKKLTSIRESLAKHGKLTGAAIEHWNGLIEYNRHDVKGMQHLFRYMINRDPQRRKAA